MKATVNHNTPLQFIWRKGVRRRIVSTLAVILAGAMLPPLQNKARADGFEGVKTTAPVVNRAANESALRSYLKANYGMAVTQARLSQDLQTVIDTATTAQGLVNALHAIKGEARSDLHLLFKDRMANDAAFARHMFKSVYPELRDSLLNKNTDAHSIDPHQVDYSNSAVLSSMGSPWQADSMVTISSGTGGRILHGRYDDHEGAVDLSVRDMTNVNMVSMMDNAVVTKKERFRRLDNVTISAYDYSLGMIIQLTYKHVDTSVAPKLHTKLNKGDFLTTAVHRGGYDFHGHVEGRAVDPRTGKAYYINMDKVFEQNGLVRNRTCPSYTHLKDFSGYLGYAGKSTCPDTKVGHKWTKKIARLLKKDQTGDDVFALRDAKLNRRQNKDYQRIMQAAESMTFDNFVKQLEQERQETAELLALVGTPDKDAMPVEAPTPTEDSALSKNLDIIAVRQEDLDQPVEIDHTPDDLPVPDDMPVAHQDVPPVQAPPQMQDAPPVRQSGYSAADILAAAAALEQGKPVVAAPQMASATQPSEQQFHANTPSITDEPPVRAWHGNLDQILNAMPKKTAANYNGPGIIAATASMQRWTVYGI